MVRRVVAHFAISTSSSPPFPAYTAVKHPIAVVLDAGPRILELHMNHSLTSSALLTSPPREFPPRWPPICADGPIRVSRGPL